LARKATAYAPGLLVSPRTRHRVRRILPIPGEVLVRVGDRVEAQQVVAQTFIPGPVTPINISKMLSMPALDVPGSMLKQVGERVAVGDLLARSKGIFGFFRQDYAATTSGTIESISEVTGQIILRGEPLPVSVKSYVSGRVDEVMPGEGCVVDAEVAMVQGIFGVGGEAYGRLRMACPSNDTMLTEDRITSDMAGCIVVGGARMTLGAIERARAAGVAAIVSGGLDDADLDALLGYTLGVAVTGSEKLGITVIITEGFGDIAMATRTYRLLASHEGATVSVNGTTQIRAGVIRPEVLVPLDAARASEDAPAAPGGAVLDVGVPVRAIRDPYFGRLGTVAALPSEPRVLESGSKARVVEVAFESGERAVLPRANVEILEG
jgi:hypothetical protein